MKLWVDDIRDAPDESWVVARKVLQAVRLIHLFDLEEISLDHDIDNRPDDETFMPIAYFIGAFYLMSKTQPKITIHSINPVGAKDMQTLLAQYGLWSDIRPYAPDIARLKREYGIE